jgi:hypothetical protein
MKKIVVISVLFAALHVQDATAQQWRERTTPHFVIYYVNASEDFISAVEEHAERYYKEISQDLGFIRYRYWRADERAQIYIYDNAEDFLASGQAAHWSSATAQTRSKIIRSFPTAHGFFDSTLPHELGHIIFREFIGHQARIPLWLEEGVAMYQEKAKRWGANDEVRRAIEEGDFMDLDELSAFFPSRRTERQKIDLFYAEAASIVYYLIQEQGTSRFVRFCRKLQDGIIFEEALKSVYIRFRNLDELNKAWVDYIKR